MPYSNHNFYFFSIWFRVGPNWDFGMISPHISCLVAIFFLTDLGSWIDFASVSEYSDVCDFQGREVSFHLTQRRDLVRGFYPRHSEACEIPSEDFYALIGEARTATAHLRQQVTVLWGDTTVQPSLSRKQVHTKAYLIMWEISRATSRERQKYKRMYDILLKNLKERLETIRQAENRAWCPEGNFIALFDKGLQGRCSLGGGRGALPPLQQWRGAVLLNRLLQRGPQVYKLLC